MKEGKRSHKYKRAPGSPRPGVPADIARAQVDQAADAPKKDPEKAENEKSAGPPIEQTVKPSRQSWRASDPPSKSMIWLTAVIAASTVVYVGVTWRGLFILRDQLKIATDQVHVGQRAYVIPERVDLIEPLAANRHVGVQFLVKNSGQTPAVNLRRAGAVVLSEQSTIPAISGVVDNPFTPGSVAFLAAGQTARAPDELWLDHDNARVLRAAELEKIQTGAIHLLVGGLIEYRDVFGHRGYTTFCARYNPSRAMFIACPNLNEVQ